MAGGVATGGSPVAAALACRAVNSDAWGERRLPSILPRYWSNNARRSRLAQQSDEQFRAVWAAAMDFAVHTDSKHALERKMAMAFSWEGGQARFTMTRPTRV
jgi:hypothetical protein